MMSKSDPGPGWMLGHFHGLELRNSRWSRSSWFPLKPIVNEVQLSFRPEKRTKLKHRAELICAHQPPGFWLSPGRR